MLLQWQRGILWLQAEGYEQYSGFPVRGIWEYSLTEELWETVFTSWVFDNAVRFSTSMSTAGHVVPGWEIPQWLEAECIGCWPGWQCWKSGVGAGKKRKMTFYNFETVRGKKPKPPFWNVRKESLKDASSQTAVLQRLSFILRFKFLYLYCLLRHLLLYLQLKICSCANLQLIYISVESFGG